MAESAPIRLAIIGINNQGLDHLEAIQNSREVTLSALCDLSLDALKRVAKKYALNNVYLDTDIQVCARRDDVDALVVALPHDQHSRVVELAIEHGKHLLKEKPIARTLAEAHQMTRALRAAGLVMHTGVQRRHHASYQFLKTQLQGAQITAGSVVMTIASKSASPRPATAPKTWRDDFTRAGGGVLIDLGYHGVDLMHFLIGPMQPISCVMQRNGAPCLLKTVDDDARLWAIAGPIWVYMRFGRSDIKTEQVTLDTARGRFVADRKSVQFTPHGGTSELLFSADKSWSETMVEQFHTFAQAIRTGESGPNHTAQQLPTMRFIEQCYAMRREQGFTEMGAPL